MLEPLAEGGKQIDELSMLDIKNSKPNEAAFEADESHLAALLAELPAKARA